MRSGAKFILKYNLNQKVELKNRNGEEATNIAYSEEKLAPMLSHYFVVRFDGYKGWGGGRIVRNIGVYLLFQYAFRGLTALTCSGCGFPISFVGQSRRSEH